jgi:hypothetical protein
MSKILPQEVEVWYLIPALRKALAMHFLGKELKQKDIAKLLGVTEAAISQYKKQKRGQETSFTKEEKKRIADIGDAMFKEPGRCGELFHTLCKSFYGSETLCKIHAEHDETLEKNCDICKVTRKDDLIQIKK